MKRLIMKTRQGLLALGLATGLAACGNSFDIQNENAPTLDDLVSAPTRNKLALTAIGINSQIRNDIGADIWWWGVFGREGYNLQGNDNRNTGELIRGPLDGGSFGAALLAGKYQALRTIDTYLKAIPGAGDMTAAEKSASAGFGKTIKALQLFRAILRNGTYGAPVDASQPVNAAPPPFLSEVNVYRHTVELLEAAKADLTAGGAAFPFPTPSGMTGFSTPATFLKFNRGLLAKVLVFQASMAACGNPCYTAAVAALNESFITTTGLPGALESGVYFTFSTAGGDATSPLAVSASSLSFFAHPSLVTGAQNRTNGSPDLRRQNKITGFTGDGGARTLDGLTGRYKFSVYFTSGSPDLAKGIPMLKNEELILLRAEANLQLGNTQAAIDDINVIRTQSGGLAPTALTVTSPKNDLISELLYNRTYSLMWESGTRWLDARRFGRLGSLPLDRAGDVTFSRMPIPTAECLARSLPDNCTPPVQ